MNVIALRAGLGVCLLAGLLVSCGKPAGQGSRSPGEPAPARSVQIVPAATRPMSRSILANGTLSAQEKSMLSAKVPGRLQQLRIDIGSPVTQGELLAQIEPRDYELKLQQSAAALAQARTALGLAPDGQSDEVTFSDVTTVKQARAVLEEASKNRERVRSLSGSGIASQSELDTVEANYTVALARHESALEDARTRVAALAQRRAEYESARKQLADASITAPFDGVVQARPASPGEFLTTGAPVVQVVKTNPLRLRLQIPERESILVRLGQPIRLSIDGDTNAYSGQIARISPALDEEVRMLLVEGDVPACGSLRPGLFARAEIVVVESELGLSVPASAVVTFAGVEKVVIVREGKALEKNVTTGRRGADWVEITSGLSVGESVVLNPAGLRTGQPVQVTERAERS